VLLQSVSVAGCRALVDLRCAGAATTTVEAAGAQELQELRVDSRVLRCVWPVLGLRLGLGRVEVRTPRLRSEGADRRAARTGDGFLN